MHEAASYLVKRGHTVHVLTTNALNSRRACLADQDTIDHVHVIRVRLFPQMHRYAFIPTLSATMDLPKLLARLDPDIIHVFSLLPSAFVNVLALLAFLTGRSVVWSPIFNPRRRNTYRGLTRVLMTFLEEKILLSFLRHSDHVIALTQEEADFYETHRITNVSVVPEAAERPEVSLEEVNSTLAKYQLVGRKFALAVGRVAPHKGLQLLVKAWRRIQQLDRDAYLVVVGPDAGSLAEIQALSDTLGCKRIMFTGAVSPNELQTLYESAHVVVSPSLFETFMRCALEAWSHKKPIACFDLGGATRFISVDSGVLVPYGDTKRLASSLIALLSDADQARGIGVKGYELYKSLYTWDVVSGQLETVYAKVLAPKTGEPQTDSYSDLHARKEFVLKLLSETRRQGSSLCISGLGDLTCFLA